MAKNRKALKNRPTAKAVLKLPDLDQAKSAVLNSLSSPDAQRGYRHALDEFIEWYCSEPRLCPPKMALYSLAERPNSPFHAEPAHQ